MITVRVVRVTCKRRTGSTYSFICDFVRMLQVVLKFVHFLWKIWRLKTKQKHNQHLLTEIFCDVQIKSKARWEFRPGSLFSSCLSERECGTTFLDKRGLEARKGCGTYGRPLAPHLNPLSFQANLTILLDLSLPVLDEGYHVYHLIFINQGNSDFQVLRVQTGASDIAFSDLDRLV